ncbi:MAG TPA: hypothetical protein VMM79_14315 [Longimicrobiales bacterium]|nr:hypothetical protein [Longimicrobiales bacterium]
MRAFDLRDAAREQGPECLATFDKAWQERSDEDFHALSDCETLAHINEAYGGIVALLADKVDDRESLLFWEIVRVIDDWRRAFEKAMPDWCADNIGEDDAGKDGAA